MKKLILFLMFSSLFRMSSFGQETGLLTGTLRDQLTNDPLFGVKVTAGGHVTRTDEAGYFSLALPAGSLDIRFNRYGLQTLDLQDIFIPGGDSVLIDTTLMPVIMPVAGVLADDNGYWVEVSWAEPGSGIAEKSYDDGQVNGFNAFEESGSQVAVKYDAEWGEHIVGGRIFVGDSTYPGPFLGTKFLVRVYDDQGMSGLPGNIIDEDTVIADQYGWVGFDSLDAVIRTDSFYMAMFQINDAPGCAPVGYSTYQVDGQTMTKYQEYNWQPFYPGNAMIRPWVAVPHDSLRVINYRIGRGSAGYFNEIASTTGCSFLDNPYPGSYGCWEYSVKALYNNGFYSSYEASNMVYHLPYYHVEIKINSSDSGWFIISNIRFKGQTPPFDIYTGHIENYNTATFNGIMEGRYQLIIYKPGYEKLILDSIDIHSDTTFEITLLESCYPVASLRVNPFTALLTWEANSISQFSWKCDTPGYCHSITTPQLDLTTTEHWTLTLSYNYNSTVEPASVDYSTDHGQTWAEFYTLSPQPGWDTVNIDLSPFSWENGESEIMFQIHDYLGQPYYLDIGEVSIWTSDIEPPPQNCLISINGETAGSTDTTIYQLTSLVNGNAYHAGVYAINCAGQADTVFTDFIYRQLFPPENLISYDKNDSLFFSWSPPSGSWGNNIYLHDYPDGLTGYILNFASKNISSYFEINDPLDTDYSMRKPTCDTSYVSVNALYNLSEYGYPGESFESLPEGPMMLNSPGPIVDEFFEDWSSMSFYVNCWTNEGNGLAIVSDAGNPGPAFVFRNSDGPYQAFLTSYPIFIPQTSDEVLTLEFDLKLISSGESGHEQLEFQELEDGTTDWIMVKGISNSFGNIDWMHFSVDLGYFIEAPLFRLRLKFAGNGGETIKWTIDNIYIHNVCHGPGSVNAEKINEDHVRLNWQFVKPRNFEKFRIYRDFDDEEYVVLAETGDTSYIDTLSSGGKYCYRVTAVYNEQGVICESLLSDSACVTSFLGVPDYPQNNRVRCYPNPAREYIMINSEEEIRSITLYNSMGKKIKVIDYPGMSYRLGLNEVSSGIYLLRIDLFDVVFLKKILLISN